MHRLIVLLVVIVGVAVASAPAVAQEDNNRGPKCADITLDLSLTTYTGTLGGSATLADVLVSTASRTACKGMTYTFFIGGTPHAIQPNVLTSFAISTAPEFISVSAASSRGRATFDTAPNAGAVTLQLNPTAAPGGLYP